MTEPTGGRAAVHEIVRRHTEHTTRLLRGLVTDELIAEHRADPLAREKSPALLHVLDVMRQAPISGKLAILARRPGEEYQIIRLSGLYGDADDLSDPRRYGTEDDALHEVFLRRLDELGLRARADIHPASDVEAWEASAEEAAAFTESLERYVIGYTDRPSVRAGESFTVHVSAHASTAVHADLVELGAGEVTGEVRERVVQDLGDLTVVHRPIPIGSTAVVEDLGALGAESRTIGVTFLPTAPGDGPQTLAAQDGASSSWALGLDDAGRMELVVRDAAGEHRIAGDAVLTSGVWYTAAATVVGELALSVRSVVPTASAWGAETTRIAEDLRAGSTATADGLPAAPLRFAARDAGDAWDRCFDGKLEAPLLSTASAVEVAEHRAALGPLDGTPGLVVAWRPAEALAGAGPAGTVIPAIPGAGRTLPDGMDALCANTPAFAVTSAAWDGSVAGFPERPELWDAVHFHRDDLDDCRWAPDLTVELPAELPSGVYAVRLTSEVAPEERIPVFVESAVQRSKVALIIPTASYLAYGNDHPGTMGQMAQATASRTPVLLWGDVFMQLHPELGRACYDAHADGTGVGYASWRRPLLNMRPTHRYHVGAWQLPADLRLVSWLRDEGIEFDVITDHGLHELGREALDRYSTVLTTTHSEYYTTSMLDAVEDWIAEGGRFLYLGANGFYWRAAIDDARPWVFELRRGENGSRGWEARPGELYHAFTGERGGLWKFQGRSSHTTFGVGFCSQGFDSAGWYRRLPDSHDPRASFIFEGVDDEVFGRLGLEGGGAAGQEIDRYDADLGSPVDALVLATSEGLSDGYLRAVEEIGFLVSGTSASSDPFVRADVTYFVNGAGGAVFSTGSIAWCGSLGIDPGVSRITGNVIRRFAQPEPLPWT
jgi:N,N-dimethylformamidase